MVKKAGGKGSVHPEKFTSEEALLEHYTDIITQLSESPYRLDLHEEHVALTRQLNMTDELESARQLMSEYFPLSEATWLEWVEDKKAALAMADQDDLEPHIALMMLYKRSVQDYLSIPLLVSYSQYFISNYYIAEGLSLPPTGTEEDAEDKVMEELKRQVSEPNLVLGAAFGIDDVRTVRDEVIAAAKPHLVESKTVWNLWRDFEMDLLRLNGGQDQFRQVDALYLGRLKTAHLDIESTFSAYSSLITQYDNAHYDTKLPAANKAYASALKLTTEREPEEAKLKQAGYSADAYLAYARWELEVKSPNVPLATGLYDRAVKDHPKNLDIWDDYVFFAGKFASSAATVIERAVKSNPESGLLWTSYFRVAETNRQGSEVVESLFTRAKGTELMAESIEDLVLLYEARAGVHRREVESLIGQDEELDGGMIDVVVQVLQEGIKAIKKASKKGDPQLRLEKHLIRLMERFGRIDEAANLWESLTKSQATSYAVWYGRADFEMRAGDLKKAHEVYSLGCSQKGLDYPEYLLEAWLAFEKHSGNLADLEYTIRKVKRQRKGLEGKRMREARQAAAALAVVQASTSTGVEASQFIGSAVEGATTSADNGKKRERSPLEEPASKKAKFEEVPTASTEPKRDRENSTVFVITTSGATMSEDQVKKLFSDCGEVREIKIKTIGERDYAMLEFMDKQSVFAAQTKDKKKINGVEVDVHIAWHSCLYITNFPESYDKDRVETLFGKYGTIFDTRWPSKRIRDKRRFCYVQFTSPESAQSALSENGTELEPGLKLQVAVSDPGARKGRTDAGANQKELYIAGLARYTKEFDLRRLFETHGTIKGIRMPVDDKGESKGYAFVEFEDEAAAKSALVLNNRELKKRNISVTFAQTRMVGVQKEGPKQLKSEIDSKRVRVKGIIKGTEEAIVQQAFEKHASVKQVLMDVGATEAVVEFADAADAGKILLLAPGDVLVDGTTVQIFPEGPQARAAQGKPPTSGGAMLPRQATRGRARVGLGAARGRGRGGIGSIGRSAAVPLPPSPLTGESSGKSQDDFRALLGGK